MKERLPVIVPKRVTGQCRAELAWPDGTIYYCVKDVGHNLRHEAITGKTTLKWAEPGVDYRKPTA